MTPFVNEDVDLPIAPSVEGGGRLRLARLMLLKLCRLRRSPFPPGMAAPKSIR